MDAFKITNFIMEKLNEKSQTAKSLAKELEIEKKTVNRHLYAMETLGIVEKQGETPPSFSLINTFNISQ